MRIRLDIYDWDFQRRPEIMILERPKALSGFRAHLGLGATLCYLDRESVHMDPYDPVSVVGWCLIKAEATLEEIAGDNPRIDFRDEFLAHWSASDVHPLLLWSASQDPKRTLPVLSVDFPHLKGWWVVTDDVERTSKTLTAAGSKVGATFADSAVEFVTDRIPSIDPDHWPPTRLKNVLEWLKGWDDKLYATFMGRLESRWTQDKKFLAALLDTPAGRFGFSFALDLLPAVELKRLARHPGDRRQRILKLNPMVSRFSVSDMSPAFMHGRNQSGRETLAAKNISIIGCGTVGGYLATFLARLGAGHEDGTIKIYEQEMLLPENLGRHVLSMRDLYRNKAEGVVEMLGREFPWIKAKARKVDATQSADLFDADLIIDASGSSAVSSALNRQHIAKMRDGNSPAMVYVWVEGPGDASRCLLVDSLNHMCHECLYTREVGQALKDRFKVSTRDAATGREYPGGCGSYMPFAVSASVATAAMCLDMARDWARGNPHPRLRSRRHDLKNTQEQKDQSPPPLESCPACRQR